VHAGDESETVWFDYPWTYESPATLDSIKLEIGPLAARSPSEEATIVPYSGSVMPDGSEAFSTTVRTVSPQRAFWEKKTIVQQEAVRPEGKRIPRRCSRHRYDLYRLGNSPRSRAGSRRYRAPRPRGGFQGEVLPHALGTSE